MRIRVIGLLIPARRGFFFCFGAVGGARIGFSGSGWFEKKIPFFFFFRLLYKFSEHTIERYFKKNYACSSISLQLRDLCVELKYTYGAE